LHRSGPVAESEPEHPGQRHLQKQETVTETSDIRRAVRPRPVRHWDLDDPERQQRRREEQLEIAERVEVPEIVPPPDESFVVAPSQELMPVHEKLQELVGSRTRTLGPGRTRDRRSRSLALELDPARVQFDLTIADARGIK
jgi:hypothetical protein